MPKFAWFIALFITISAVPQSLDSSRLAEGQRATWRAEISASSAISEAQDFGENYPSFLGFRWKGSLPGPIALTGSLDGSLVLSSYKPSALTLARLRQWNIRARTAWAKLSVGRLFVTWGLPMGYLDGMVLESKVLGPWGIRALIGQPTTRGRMGRGLSLGGGVTFRGRLGVGALHGDLGALRTAGATWMHTGLLTEKVPYIRKELAGGSLVYSSYSTTLSSIVQYDTLYLRWSEIRTSASYRLRNRTSFRAEHRYRSPSLPNDSLLITFAGAGNYWHDFILGLDLPVGPAIIWLDGGMTPSRRGYWSAAGLRSRPRSWLTRSRENHHPIFINQWSLTGRRESGAGGESFRVLSRIGLRPGQHLRLGLGGGVGRLRFSDRLTAEGINGWDAWLRLGTVLGPGEATLSLEIQSWREGEPDRRGQTTFSLPFGPGARPWKKPR